MQNNKIISFSCTEIIGICIPNIAKSFDIMIDEVKYKNKKFVMKAGGILDTVNSDYQLQEFEYFCDLIEK